MSEDMPQEFNEQAIKDQLIREHQQREVKKASFPTEIIDLPSKGLLYPEGHPLATGQIEMKYMTAKEEDILSSPNLLKQGKAIDKLLQSLIVTPININDLILGDKNAIMYAARVLGYGKDYSVKYDCKECGEENAQTFDLTKFEDKEVNYDLYTRENKFSFDLPRSQRQITFKLLTHGDEQALQSELKAVKIQAKKTGIDRTNSTRLKYVITSVDGNTDKQVIRSFVDDELFATDSMALRKFIMEVTPDINTEVTYACSHCGEMYEDDIALDVNFFWPGA